MRAFEAFKKQSVTIQGQTKTVDNTGGAFATFIKSKGGTYTPPVVEPTLGELASKKAQKILTSGADTVIPFGEGVLHPVRSAKKVGGIIANAVEEPFKKAQEATENIISDLKTGRGSIAQDFANLINIGLGVGGVLFSPITSVIKTGQKIPGAKPVADLFEYTFGKLGEGGAYLFGEAIDRTPDKILAQKSKDILKQPVEEAGAFAAQILIGHLMMKKVKETKNTKEEITPEIANEIVKEVKTEALKIETEVKKTSVEPTEAQKPSAFEQFNKEKAATPEDISQTSFKAQQEASRMGKEIPTEDLIRTDIDRMKMTEEATKAQDLIKTNIEFAKEAVRTEITPEAVRPQTIYTELYKKARAENDISLMTELATDLSRIGKETGRSLKALDFIDDITGDPLAGLKSIRLSKEIIAEKNMKGKTIEKAVKEEASKAEKVKEITVEAWNDFISNIPIC